MKKLSKDLNKKEIVGVPTWDYMAVSSKSIP